MKKSILLFSVLFVLKIHAQQITNVVYVGRDGITDNVKRALSIVIVKQFDNYFERLDYNKAGPLMKSRSYKDSGLTILDGRYFEYAPNGRLIYSGTYKDNKKTANWINYDDTGKIIKWLKYENDTLVETVDLTKKDTSKKYDDEREAQFPGGDRAWKDYMYKSFDKNETVNKIIKGGNVIASFKVDVNGVLQDIYLTKSVEFALDQDLVEIIRSSPKWTPAWQNGHAVNAYRKQPISFYRE